MATRRERLERKLDKRREWADKAESRSNQLAERSEKMMSIIPMGQPILIGHHSEKRDRNYRNRAWNMMGRSVEQRDLAAHHESKADGLESQLDRAIFSDDADAVQELEIRIKNNETKREHMKEVNRLYRKGDAASLAGLGINLDELRKKLEAAGSYWGQAPHLPYEFQNLSGRIASDRKRLEQVKAQQARHAQADAAPNGITLEPCSGGYCRVTFAEKPDRSILDALKAAGFWWAKGSWAGKTESLPAEVKAMIEPPSSPQQEPRIIKGAPGGPDGKWKEVQAIQYEPFIYIHYNGSHWAGEEPDDVTVLLEVLSKHKLRADFGYYTVDPCAGVENPDWTQGSNLPQFIDGPRMYACDGVYSFSGNFEQLSHAFHIDTNHKPTIDALVEAYRKNAEIHEHDFILDADDIRRCSCGQVAPQ